MRGLVKYIIPQTNNTFSYNPLIGTITFTPSQIGNNTFSIRVKEYRSGVLIGWITRDIDVVVTPFTLGTAPAAAVLYDSLGNIIQKGSNGRINGCIGQKMRFDFSIKSQNPNTKLFLTDNHQFILPQAIITYTNQKHDSVRGSFSWTPTVNDVGTKLFYITITDSTCSSPNVVLTYYEAIPIYIWGPAQALQDTSVCVGTSVYLKAYGGNTYQWYVLPGGSSGSLSCNNCFNPTATPTSTTAYAVVATDNTYCPNNKDTVTVTVTPVYPNTMASNDTAICEGDMVTLSAAGGTGSYTWKALPGGSSNSLNCYSCSAPTASPVKTTRYLLLSNANNCYNNADTVTVTVNPITNKYPTLYIEDNTLSALLPGATVTFKAYVTDCSNYTLLWMKNGIPVSGTTGIYWVTNTVNNNDTVTCQLICNDICPASTSIPYSNKLVMRVLTSVPGLEHNTGISVYPNPNTGRFIVNMPPLTNAANITVTNALGAVVYAAHQVSLNQKEIILSVPQGIYFLHVNDKVVKFTVQ